MVKEKFEWFPTAEELKTYKAREVEMAKANILFLRDKGFRPGPGDTLHTPETFAKAMDCLENGR
jgi:hypothetical protein